MKLSSKILQSKNITSEKARDTVIDVTTIPRYTPFIL